MSPPTKAVTKSHVVETQHDEMIVRPSVLVTRALGLADPLPKQHDAQMDYYGKRLATCSSDRTIRVFDVVDGEAKGEPDILRGSVPLLCISLSRGFPLASQRPRRSVLEERVSGRRQRSSPSRANQWTQEGLCSGARVGGRDPSVTRYSLQAPTRPSSSLTRSPTLLSFSSGTLVRRPVHLSFCALSSATWLPSGSSRGPTLRLARSSPRPRTTARCSSGRRRAEPPSARRRPRRRRARAALGRTARLRRRRRGLEQQEARTATSGR